MNDVRVETDIMMYLSTDDIKRLGKSFHGQELSLQEFVVALRELLAEHITDQVEFTAECIDLFETVDANGDGALDWDEFSKFMREAANSRNLDKTMHASRDMHFASFPFSSSNTQFKAKSKTSVIAPMLCIPKLRVIILYEHHSDVVQLFRVPLLDGIGNVAPPPRWLASISHHTCYVSHKLTCAYFIHSRDILITSSFTVSQPYVSLWDLVDVTKPTLLRQLHVTIPITCFAWCESSQLFAAASDLETANNVQTRRVTFYDLMGKSKDNVALHLSTVTVVLSIFLNKNELLLSCGKDGNIILYDVMNSRTLWNIQGHKGGVSHLIFSKNIVASVGRVEQNSIVIWKISDTECCRHTVLSSHQHPIIGISFNDRVERLCSADTSGSVLIWDATRWSLLQVCTAGDKRRPFSSILLTQEGTHTLLYVASGAISRFRYCPRAPRETIIMGTYIEVYNMIAIVTDKLIYLWDATSGELKHTNQGACGTITACCSDDRGRKLILGDKKGRIVVTNLINGALMKDLDPFEDEIVALRYIAGTKLIIAACYYSKFRIYDDETSLGFYQPMAGPSQSVIMKTTELQAPLDDDIKDHGRISAVELSDIIACSVNQTIATVSHAGSTHCHLNVWSLHSGRLLNTCLLPSSLATATITCVTFVSSHPVIIAGLSTGHVVMWGIDGSLRPFECLAVLQYKSEDDHDDDQGSITTLEAMHSTVSSQSQHGHGGVAIYAGDTHGYIHGYYFSDTDLMTLGGCGRLRRPSKPRHMDRTQNYIALSWRDQCKSARPRIPVTETSSSFASIPAAHHRHHHRHQQGYIIFREPHSHWKAHDTRITSITLLENASNIITTSSKGHVACWSRTGTDQGELSTVHVNDLSVQRKKNVKVRPLWTFPVNRIKSDKKRLQSACDLLVKIKTTSTYSDIGYRRNRLLSFVRPHTAEEMIKMNLEYETSLLKSSCHFIDLFAMTRLPCTLKENHENVKNKSKDILRQNLLQQIHPHRYTVPETKDNEEDTLDDTILIKEDNRYSLSRQNTTKTKSTSCSRRSIGRTPSFLTLPSLLDKVEEKKKRKSSLSSSTNNGPVSSRVRFGRLDIQHDLELQPLKRKATKHRLLSHQLEMMHLGL